MSAASVLAAPTLQIAINRYIEHRNIGASAADLIPAEIRQPLENAGDWLLEKLKIQRSLRVDFDDKGFYWTHTPGRLKLGTLFVRSAWSKP